MTAVIEVTDLGHCYPPARRGGAPRQALQGLSFTIAPGECFAWLGPNGGGKSTLFRILTTASRPMSGRVRVLGIDAASDPEAIRRRIGVVFQSPALDPALSVQENLCHHGHLYGLRGADLTRRIESLISRLGVSDRLADRVGTLSGGLARRVELARALLHDPELLLMDEPSTGLDPAARRQWWELLQSLRKARALTVVLTTHLMEEADLCDRVALLDEGRWVTGGTPESLKATLGGEVIWLDSREADALARQVADRFGVGARVVDSTVRIESHPGPAFLPEVLSAFPGRVQAVRLGRPTLEDVFVHHTGHRFL